MRLKVIEFKDGQLTETIYYGIVKIQEDTDCFYIEYIENKQCKSEFFYYKDCFFLEPMVIMRRSEK